MSIRQQTSSPYPQKRLCIIKNVKYQVRPEISQEHSKSYRYPEFRNRGKALATLTSEIDVLARATLSPEIVEQL